MKLFLLFSVLIVAIFAAQMTQADRDAVLNYHNSVRASVEPVARPSLRPFEYSMVNEADASSAAQSCNVKHIIVPGSGQNIYAGAATFGPPDSVSLMAYAVYDWEKESAYYNVTAPSCEPGKVCGHYTQEVWNTTQTVGCGYQICDNTIYNNPYFPGYPLFWVVFCNYSPGGNNPSIPAYST